jgi:hypothetical protein
MRPHELNAAGIAGKTFFKRRKNQLPVLFILQRKIFLTVDLQRPIDTSARIIPDIAVTARPIARFGG